MKNKKIIVFLISLLVIIVGVSIYFINKQKSDNNGTKDKDKVETKVEKQDYIKDKKYYQDSVVVGADYTGLYYFEDDKVYYLNDRLAIKENQVLAFVGTWKIEDNKLFINVTKKFNAVGGKIESDVILGETLVDYNIELQDVKEVRIYSLEKKDEDGIKYIGGDIVLYEVNINENNILDKFANLKNGKYKNNQ